MAYNRLNSSITMTTKSTTTSKITLSLTGFGAQQTARDVRGYIGKDSNAIAYTGTWDDAYDATATVGSQKTSCTITFTGLSSDTTYYIQVQFKTHGSSYENVYVSPNIYGARAVTTDAPAPTTYTFWGKLIFDANGGTGGTPSLVRSTTTQSSSSATISVSLSDATPPTRDGHVFLGWGNTKTTTSPISSPCTFLSYSQDVLHPQEHTIYAIWAAITYTYSTGNAVTVQSIKKTAADFHVTFNTSATRKIKIFYSTSAYYFSIADMGWNGDPTGITVEERTVTGSSATITLTGFFSGTTYYFKAMYSNDTPDASHHVTVYTNPSRLRGTDPKSFTTEAEETEYTLAYLKNVSSSIDVYDMPEGESVSTTASSVTFSIPTKEPYRLDNYDFSSWNTKSDGSGTTKLPGSTITLYKSSPVEILYAMWIRVYRFYAKIIFNTNGGSGGPSASSSSAGSYSTSGAYVSFHDPSSSPTKTGFTFQGWGESSTSTSAVDWPYDVWSNSQDISSPVTKTLYAIWEQSIHYNEPLVLSVNSSTSSSLNITATTSYVRDYARTVIIYDDRNNELGRGNISIGSVTKTINCTGLTAGTMYTLRAKMYASSTQVGQTQDETYGYTRFAFSWTHPKVSGQPFKLTASEWTSYTNLLKQKASRHGYAKSFSPVSDGNPFTAGEFNEVSDALYDIKSSRVITRVSTGDIIYASYMNNMVTYLNDEDN